VRRVDLGPCAGLLHDNDPSRCVVVLPGMRYSTQAPLLGFPRETAGWLTPILNEDRVVDDLSRAPLGELP
jgi:hypothetical protein